MEAFTFFLAAIISLAGACGVVFLKNPVHAALSLVATLFGVAIHFINLEAYFVAAVQVIVYAGAIVILFLFVIMLLGVDRAESIKTDPIIGQRQIAILAVGGILALGALIGVAFSGDVTGVPPENAQKSSYEGGTAINSDHVHADDDVRPDQNIKDIGRALFSTRFVFALEITALLLTIGVVGAVVLTRRPKGELDPLPDDDPPSIYRDNENSSDLESTLSRDTDALDDAKADESEKDASEETEVGRE